MFFSFFFSFFLRAAKEARRGFAIHAIEAVIALFLVLGFIIFITPGLITAAPAEDITRATAAAAIKAVDDNQSLRAPALAMNFSALNSTFYNVLPRDVRFAVGVCNSDSAILNFSIGGGAAAGAAHYLRAPPNATIRSLSMNLVGGLLSGSFPSNLTLDAGNDTLSDFAMTGELNGPLRVGSALLGAAVNASNRWLQANPGCDSYLDFPVSNATDNLCEVPLIWGSDSPGSAALTQRVCVSSREPPANFSIVTLGYVISGSNATFRPSEFVLSAWRG